MAVTSPVQILLLFSMLTFRGVLGGPGGSHLTVGGIIGIVVAAVLGFLFILFCCSWCARIRLRKRQYTHLRSPGTAVNVYSNTQGTTCGAMQYPRPPPPSSCCGPPPPPPPSSCCGNQPLRAGMPYNTPYTTSAPPPYAPAPPYPTATHSVPEEQQHLVYNPGPYPYPPPSAPPPGYPPQD